jgi:hypothetical protein
LRAFSASVTWADPNIANGIKSRIRINLFIIIRFCLLMKQDCLPFVYQDINLNINQNFVTLQGMTNYVKNTLLKAYRRLFECWIF